MWIKFLRCNKKKKIKKNIRVEGEWVKRWRMYEGYLFMGKMGVTNKKSIENNSFSFWKGMVTIVIMTMWKLKTNGVFWRNEDRIRNFN